MITPATLGKKERLKSRKSLDQLFSEGQKFSVAPFRVFWLPVAEKGLRASVGVSAKNFKRSVDRNRIKRQIRESYRLQKAELVAKVDSSEKGLNIFFIYTEKELPAFIVLKEKMQVALKKIQSQL
jgi:ribonuclease P protein component